MVRRLSSRSVSVLLASSLLGVGVEPGWSWVGEWVADTLLSPEASAVRQVSLLVPSGGPAFAGPAPWWGLVGWVGVCL